MNKVMFTIGFLGVFGFSSFAQATEIEGVNVADTAMVGGEQLKLNGAGVRSKFFFDIYIAALYLPEKTKDAEQAMTIAGNKRTWMHFLYDEVSRDKLIKGWAEGFENNQSKEEMGLLHERLSQFNAMFGDMKKGDEITFDFIADEVRVSINQQDQGSIKGKDFQKALLLVWLGLKPADHDLKEELLGED